MGKYDRVLSNLPTLPPEDDSYQAKVNEAKSTLRAAETHTPESLARAYQAMRLGTGPMPKQEQRDQLVSLLGKEGLEDLLYDANLKLEALEQLLIESHDGDETGWGQYGAKPNAVRLSSGATIRVQVEPTGKVLDKEKFRQWCLANGLEQKLQLWPSTMKSIAKERLLAGATMPDGVEVYTMSKIVYVKAETE